MWTYCYRHLLLLSRDNAAVPGATSEQTEPLVSLLGIATGCMLTELRQGWPRLVECEATALGEAVAEHRLTAIVGLQTLGFLVRRKTLHEPGWFLQSLSHVETPETICALNHKPG